MLPDSQQEYPIIGLNLLRLLVQNRTAEFHTELELLSPEVCNGILSVIYPFGTSGLVSAQTTPCLSVAGQSPDETFASS